jgi:hypothetical protein
VPINLNLEFKKRRWLELYLDQDNPFTFFNATQAVKTAGFIYSNDQCYSQMGINLKHAYAPTIRKWLDRIGLSDNALRQKLYKLLNATETKFFSYEGEVVEERDVEALGIQVKALDMAFKLRGDYAPRKTELSGPGGGPVPVASINVNMTPKEAAKVYQRMLKGE